MSKLDYAEEKPVKRLYIDKDKLSQLLTALTECMETGEFDYANACIHELELSDGSKCQIILEIEIEDDQGKFPSELTLNPLNACIKTQH